MLYIYLITIKIREYKKKSSKKREVSHIRVIVRPAIIFTMKFHFNALLEFQYVLRYINKLLSLLMAHVNVKRCQIQ